MSTEQNRIPFRAITKQALQLGLLLTAVLFLCACQQEAKVEKSADPTGVYALVSVSGNKVPASVAHDGNALQGRSGTFTINADETCSTKTVFVPPSGSEVAREVTATYTKEGSKLTMRWKDAGTTTGTIEGSTFTMNNEGMMFVYRK
jgi:hypothetical protein